MKDYNFIKLNSLWSPDQLRNDFEKLINEKAKSYLIISVLFKTVDFINPLLRFVRDKLKNTK